MSTPPDHIQPGDDLGVENARSPAPRRSRAIFIFQASLVLAVIVALNELALRYVHIGVDQQQYRCMPYTAYLVVKARHRPERGDLVFYEPDERVAPFFPVKRNWVKKVAGVPGDIVRIHEGRVTINGEFIHELETGPLRRLGGPRPDYYDVEVTIPPDRYYVLGTEPHSFDSRYWGLLHVDQVRGRAYPLY